MGIIGNTEEKSKGGIKVKKFAIVMVTIIAMLGLVIGLLVYTDSKIELEAVRLAKDNEIVNKEKVEKKTADEIQLEDELITKPEYQTFESFVENYIKFSEEKPEYFYSENDYKEHMLLTSVRYFKYFIYWDLVPYKVKDLAEEGLQIGEEYKNTIHDDLDELYQQVNKSHQELVGILKQINSELQK